MKELKFRAWDGKKMIDDVIPASETSIIELFEYEWQEIEVKAVEQYTGLKDKNGKEIYEGDIVKIQNTTARLPYEYITDGTPIYYEHGAFRFNAGKGEYLIPDEMFMEVIGNIHENADLLEDK